MVCVESATYRQEIEDLHLACKALVRACEQVTYDVLLDTQVDGEAATRVADILDSVRDEWLEILRVLDRLRKEAQTFMPC